MRIDEIDDTFFSLRENRRREQRRRNRKGQDGRKRRDEWKTRERPHSSGKNGCFDRDVRSRVARIVQNTYYIRESFFSQRSLFRIVLYICKEHLRRQAVCLYIIDQTIRIICKGILLLVHIGGEKKKHLHTLVVRWTFERSSTVSKYYIPRVYINMHAPNHLHTFKYFYNNLLFYLYHKFKNKKKKKRNHATL